jgi:hypothetical protein
LREALRLLTEDADEEDDPAAVPARLVLLLSDGTNPYRYRVGFQSSHWQAGAGYSDAV